MYEYGDEKSNQKRIGGFMVVAVRGRRVYAHGDAASIGRGPEPRRGAAPPAYVGTMSTALDLALAVAAFGNALAFRPWRAVGAGGPPWPWLGWALVMPALWSADRLAATPFVQPLSGACLLMLMAGWPLAVLLMLPVTLLVVALGAVDAAAALQRAVWLGVLPATAALALGAALRRWLPNQLFVYILGRGFFATAIAGSTVGALSAALHGAPAGLEPADLALARVLASWGDAFLTGMLVSIFVAFRPQWLATYADRIWLIPPPPDQKS
jgi:uncharacterized membrane protein